jgi:alkyldihydroxyacetonephosphate synthase
MAQDRSKLRWNGWGFAAHKDDIAGREEVWRRLAAELGMPALLATPPRPLDELKLPAARLSSADRAMLAAIVGADQLRNGDFERAFHAQGRSYLDLLRLRSGDLSSAPDAVVYPRSTEEVLAVLALAATRHIAVMPFGGGSGAVGWANAMRSDYEAALALDLSEMDRVIEIDPVAATATVEAGIAGPALENALKAKGHTLGHFPQSFEFSTLGGWIAQSGAGQASPRYGRAGDWLLSVKLATPVGLLETGHLPAGPQLKDIVCGSEGVLGVVTEAVIRLRPQPFFSEVHGFLCRDLHTGLEIMRLSMQSDCPPALLQLADSEALRFCRGFDMAPTLLQKLGNTLRRWRGYGEASCLLLAGFEGDTQTAVAARRRFAVLAGRHGALALGRGPGEDWRRTRFRLPYRRDTLLDRGVGVEIVETSAGWSRLEAIPAAVRQAVASAAEETLPREGARALVLCQAAHADVNGASLTFTIVFPRRLEGDIAQAQKIKAAATGAILAAGGTLSHHHGIGRDHLAWMERETGKTGLDVLGAIKKNLDPEGIMNPGKLLP